MEDLTKTYIEFDKEKNFDNKEENESPRRKERTKRSFQQFDLASDLSTFSLNDLLELSTGSGDQMSRFDQNYLKMGGFLPRFLLIYTLHLIFLMPFLAVSFFILGLIKGTQLIFAHQYKASAFCILLYTFDSFLHMSYIFCFINIYIQNDAEIYRNWNILCFVLYAFHLFVMVSVSIQYINSLRDLFSPEHLKYFGFRCINFYETKILKNKNHENYIIKKKFQGLFLDLNLDHSVFKYTTYGDILTKEAPEGFNKYCALNPVSNALKINANNKGEDLLLEIFYTGKEKVEESLNTFNMLTYWGMMATVVVLKIILPISFALGDDVNFDSTNKFGFISVILFYIQMIITIFPLISSEDLKTKTLMLEDLVSNLDISRGEITQEMKKRMKNETLIKGFIGLLQMQETLKNEVPSFDSSAEILTSNPLHIYLFNLAMKEKIDSSCMLSIETWDNCRKALHEFDNNRSELYEAIMLFLGVYCFFLILILLSVVYDVYILFAKDSAITSQFLISIFTIDLGLFIMLFLNRIYYGNMYNQTFMKEKQSIECLINIYVDLFEFYDYYINDHQLKTDNPFYDFLKKRIIERKDQIEAINSKDFRNEGEVNKHLQAYLKRICVVLKGIQKDIDSDAKKLSHNFLGLIESDFKNTLIQLGMVMIPLVPTIYGRYLTSP